MKRTRTLQDRLEREEHEIKEKARELVEIARLSRGNDAEDLVADVLRKWSREIRGPKTAIVSGMMPKQNACVCCGLFRKVRDMAGDLMCSDCILDLMETINGK